VCGATSKDSVVTRRSLGIVAGVSQIEFWLVQAGMTTSQMSPGSGAPLDTRQQEMRNDLFRYVFDIRRRKVLVWIRYGEHIQIRHFLVVNLAIQFS